ncbi:hypothetical protein KIW84_073438 [Lathyrus oleraceus]|uniref:Reverse transcriptase n=1 Tax=Pisum sativum TaxID=3888 RepID=A0A9D4VNN3_PEA|nr:hypothetical protein KIW84_073438 [Pisum sativum]
MSVELQALVDNQIWSLVNLPPGKVPIGCRQYTLELLQDTGNLASKPSATPFDPSLKNRVYDGTPLSDPTIYRRLLGRLIYLTNSRPAIRFAV